MQRPSAFAVVGELTRKPEWGRRSQRPRNWAVWLLPSLVDEGGNAYYVHGKECAIIDPEGMVY